MTRRTQKSSRQRKRQSTRRHGGMDRRARGKCIKGFIEILINGVRQCIKKPEKSVKINNDYEIVNNSGYMQRKEPTPKKINNNKNKNKK